VGGRDNIRCRCRALLYFFTDFDDYLTALSFYSNNQLINSYTQTNICIPQNILIGLGLVTKKNTHMHKVMVARRTVIFVEFLLRACIDPTSYTVSMEPRYRAILACLIE
jgi:hypothetical protein